MFIIPPGFTVSASATDAAIQKNIFGSGMETLIISNEEMNDIMKIVKSLKESGLLKMVLVKQFKMKQKNKTVDFLECYY